MEYLPESETKLYLTLKQTFGYHSFRPHQKETIQAILGGRDAFVVMPSGGGKSLCYQIPASMMDGTCVVISPLISLMKDQVDNARTNGLTAACYNSSQTMQERNDVLAELHQNALDLLYISPERLTIDRFRSRLKQINIDLFAVDEAHCISEWGHDFRPDYMYLKELKTEFPDSPVAGFTATATPRVQKDIMRRLQLDDPHMVRASFDRPNFFYQVEPKQNVLNQILEFVRPRAGQSGVVYRTTRDDVESTADFLADKGISALPYHAGLNKNTRRKHQEEFHYDRVDVIVATVAFGMGIDKPNVRYVVHGDLPKNLESYYQETGRAGRDGDPAHCLLLFSPGDAATIRYFINEMDDPQEQERCSHKLSEMVRFGSVNICRRRQLLNYFGEEYEEDNCGACDVCTADTEQIDITREAQILMSAIVRTNQRYGAGKIVDIVSGANTKAVRQNNLDTIKTYGAGSDKTKKYWRKLIDELITHDCIHQTRDQYPVLKLTQHGRDVLVGEESLEVARRKEDVSQEESFETASCDEELFNRLRGIRSKLADAEDLPAFTIFHDRTLREMAISYPTTPEQLRHVHGVGDVKLENYGETFMTEIRRYLRQNPDIDPPDKPPSTSTGTTKSKSDVTPTVEKTWELAKKGMNIEEIAEHRNIKPDTVAGYIERLILADRPVEKDQFVDEDTFTHLQKLFSKLGTDRLAPVVKATEEDVTYGEARLVRAFMKRDTAQPTVSDNS